ncbi:MAG TPA: hypothetical protein PLS89_14210, partial [Syntrophales bacterium]|nr:hypothetical protein [Syntrophales bacterium]
VSRGDTGVSESTFGLDLVPRRPHVKCRQQFNGKVPFANERRLYRRRALCLKKRRQKKQEYEGRVRTDDPETASFHVAPPFKHAS